MTQPLISVIVPCYNVEEFIQDTVECILNQTYVNWELILVDDGSKDRTPQLLDTYAVKDSRIRVIHKPNGGLVSARNAGFDVIRGEWHTYVDGDDWVDTDMLEKLVAYVNRYEGVEIVFWKLVQELGDKSVKGKMEWKCEEQEYLYIGDECHLLAANTLVYKSGIATAFSKLILTDYARKNHISHNKVLRQGSEGVEFSLRSFYYAKKALFVNEYFNHYRYNPSSISKKIDEQNTVYLAQCYNKIYEEINLFPDKERFIIPFYERVAYVVIAIAMGTYFHPNNIDSLYTKSKKFGKVLKEYDVFRLSVKRCKTDGMDSKRKFTLLLIRMKLYFALQIIASLKQYFLKKGRFNY